MQNAATAPAAPAALPTTNPTTSTAKHDEYITIIAPTFTAVMQRFQESDLAAQGYSIAGPVGRHHFSYAGKSGSTDLFDGARMIAATFFRAANQS